MPPRSQPPVPEPSQRGVLPWFTIVYAVIALAVHLVPAWREPAFYLRAALFEGEFWRLWTGHTVHFSGSHLLWNLAVFVPSGVWLERLDPRGGRVFLAVAAPAIAGLLLVCDSTLLRYGGLSGLATGTLVFLAAIQLTRRDPREPVWFWLAVLGLVAAKLVFEQVSGAPLLVSDLGDVRTVPLAHLGGAACALGGWAWRFRALRRAAQSASASS
jgi:rhomboid family GlyGly-CTERM serine protease